MGWAGIRAVKLEELERRLRNDLTQEAMVWGSRVLLHREVAPAQAHGPLTRASTPSASHSPRRSPRRSPSLQALPTAKRVRFNDPEMDLQPQTSDDVTKKEDDTSRRHALVAFWEGTGERTCLLPGAHGCSALRAPPMRGQHLGSRIFVVGRWQLPFGWRTGT